MQRKEAQSRQSPKWFQKWNRHTWYAVIVLVYHCSPPAYDPQTALARLRVGPRLVKFIDSEKTLTLYLFWLAFSPLVLLSARTPIVAATARVREERPS
ncbi:hypothetical protein CEXT_719751 [Caerostris extrusa]|uniref:Uncharacterized protein n=1 Tax=Caerostris extrusa TaxID=172846 RepID=A0AAV4Y2S1_CAEEX|nr:hypothetical protein CEXT_719751 [Caerostris extrusa]